MWAIFKSLSEVVSTLTHFFSTTQFSRSDPRYWAWDVKDIGMYDVPAIVEYVLKETGVKVNFDIGFSLSNKFR